MFEFYKNRLLYLYKLLYLVESREINCKYLYATPGARRLKTPFANRVHSKMNRKKMIRVDAIELLQKMQFVKTTV